MRRIRYLVLLGTLFIVGPMAVLYRVGIPVLYGHNEPEVARIATVFGPMMIVGVLFLCLALLCLAGRR